MSYLNSNVVDTWVEFWIITNAKENSIWKRPFLNEQEALNEYRAMNRLPGWVLEKTGAWLPRRRKTEAENEFDKF